MQPLPFYRRCRYCGTRFNPQASVYQAFCSENCKIMYDQLMYQKNMMEMQEKERMHRQLYGVIQRNADATDNFTRQFSGFIPRFTGGNTSYAPQSLTRQPRRRSRR